LVLNHSGILGEDTPWLVQDSTTPFSLYSVTGDGDGNLFAVGNNGVVISYDGETWSSMSPDHNDRLNAADLDPCGNLIGAGHWGTVLRHGY